MNATNFIDLMSRTNTKFGLAIREHISDGIRLLYTSMIMGRRNDMLHPQPVPNQRAILSPPQYPQFCRHMVAESPALHQHPYGK